MSLPRFLVLGISGNRFLRYRHEEGQYQGFIHFLNVPAVSPESKFEVEPSQTHPGLVNIRSCYCNKYWVLQNSTGRFLKAASEKVDEDASSWSCTLFEPIFEGLNINFRHVHLQEVVDIWQGAGLSLSLHVPDKTESMFAIRAVDWETLCILPKYITFKGDNGKYLQVRTPTSAQFLQFSSTEIGKRAAHHEVSNVGEGAVIIKSLADNSVWMVIGKTYVVLSGILTGYELEKSFIPVRLMDNVIILNSCSNNNICQRFNMSIIYTDLLNANATNISDETRLIVEEPVISRTIYNVNFRLNDARIYNEHPRSVVSGRQNASPVEVEIEMPMAYEFTVSGTWKDSISITRNVSTSIITGIPFISEVGIEIGNQTAMLLKWGETKVHPETEKSIRKVTLPPWTRVIMTMVGTEGTCDVPFSYNQRDTLHNYEIVDECKNDGAFSGIYTYNFSIEHQLVPMTPAEVTIELAKQKLMLTEGDDNIISQEQYHTDVEEKILD